MSSVRVPRRCEVESSVFTMPGDISPMMLASYTGLACGFETAFPEI